MWQNRITVWRIPIHQRLLLTVLQRFVYPATGIFDKTLSGDKTLAYSCRRKTGDTNLIYILHLYSLILVVE